MTTQQERTCSQIVCSYKVEIRYNETCFIWSITTYFVCERIKKKMGKTTVNLKIFSGGATPRTPHHSAFLKSCGERCIWGGGGGEGEQVLAPAKKKKKKERKKERKYMHVQLWSLLLLFLHFIFVYFTIFILVLFGTFFLSLLLFHSPRGKAPD